MISGKFQRLGEPAQNALGLWKVSPRTQRAGFFVAGTLMGAMLVLAMQAPPAQRAGPQRSEQTSRPPSLAPAGPRELDLLRDEAGSGNELSNWTLANALLDRYDTSADPSELYEAIVWLDRQWDRNGRAELAARVTARYCGQRVVRWHWLCVPGE
ncbi:hypothetical protein [Variovorax saccharolyticus]|uniref:hypothetical protein n=1 Tax=Variovorax saccharolyticus TaxID=3053516 RepID=UPI002576FDC3|nr:hypothetical protein [Variovorax sp. J22R187]MDM0021920.1 hypothetical protein [Variovorax sp. J22R187]